MLWKHAALGDERGFATYLNVEASSLTTGYGAALAAAAASFDGTKVCLSGSGATGRQTGFIGIAARDIAPNSYGLLQVFGPCASVFISNVGTSITITLGDACVPGALAGGFFSSVPTWLNSGFGVVVAISTPAAVSAAGYMTGFVRHIL